MKLISALKVLKIESISSFELPAFHSATHLHHSIPTALQISKQKIQ